MRSSARTIEGVQGDVRSCRQGGDSTGKERYRGHGRERVCRWLWWQMGDVCVAVAVAVVVADG